jgi:hypothetical protein
MCLKPDTDETFNDLESPERTHESQMLDESEIRDLIQTLDTDHISREVFALFGVQFELDPSLSLRRVQVLRA